MLLIIGQRKRSNREEEVEYNCKREGIERGRRIRSEQWWDAEPGQGCVYICKHLSCSGCFSFYPILLGWVKSPLSAVLEEEVPSLYVEAEGRAFPLPSVWQSAHGFASETFAANFESWQRDTHLCVPLGFSWQRWLGPARNSRVSPIWSSGSALIRSASWFCEASFPL